MIFNIPAPEINFRGFFIFISMQYTFLDAIIAKLESISAAKKAGELQEFLRNTFTWQLQKALLNGEYYGEADERIMRIDRLLDTFKQGAPKIVKIGTKSYEIKSNITEFTLWADKYLPLYQDLIRNLEKGMICLDKGEESKVIDLKMFEGHTFFRDISEIMDVGSKKVDFENYNTFLIGILLVYIDEYLECTEEVLRVLGRIKHFLEQTRMNTFSREIITLYKHKTEFLIYKIECRYSHRTNEGERGDRNPGIIADDNVFAPFVKKIKEHYLHFYYGSPDELYTKVCNMLEGQPENFNIEILHRFNKYYGKINDRDFAFNKNKIDKILEKLKANEQRLKGDTLFDRIAYKSILNLLNNSSSRLRQKIEQANHYPNILPHFREYLRGDNTEVLPEMIKNLIEEAGAASESNGFSDYFCYVNLLKFLNELTNFLLENASTLIVEKEPAISSDKLRERFSVIVKTLTKIYQQAVNDLKDSLRKTRSYESKPVYLTMKECLIGYELKTETGGSVKGSLFLDSAYILPNNFEKIQQKADTWEAFITPQMNLLREAFDVVLASHSVKASITVFEGKMKENDFKVVQVVALFVSIATFVLINVKIFDGKSGMESFGIILGLASCFFLFNLFLYFIFLAQFRGGTAAKGYLLKIILWLVTPLGLATGSYFILDSQHYKSSSEVKSIKERLYRDSVQLEYLKEKVK